MSAQKKKKQIVEYVHMAPVRVPDADVTPEAMHEVIRRLEAIVDPTRGIVSAELSKDICRLLASRHREWLRADRAERDQCRSYIAGRNDAHRAMQFDWWRRRAEDWRGEYLSLLETAGPQIAREASLNAARAATLADAVSGAPLAAEGAA